MTLLNKPLAMERTFLLLFRYPSGMLPVSFRYAGKIDM